MAKTAKQKKSEVSKAERAYLASHRAEARYTKMFKTRAYKNLSYAKQKKYANQWANATKRTQKSFNKVLRLRRTG